MAEGEHLGLECGPAAKQRSERPKSGQKGRSHAAVRLTQPPGFLNDHGPDQILGRHRHLGRTPRGWEGRTPEYRKIRAELLEAETALKDQRERVAALRRTLPLKGVNRSSSNAYRQVSSCLFESGARSLIERCKAIAQHVSNCLWN